MKKLILALLASTAAISAAQAQDLSAPHAYIGVGVASADHEQTSGFSNDGYKASGKVFGGYEFNQTVGVEAGYTDFRKSSVSGAAGSGNTEGYSYYVAGKLSTPLYDRVVGYAKLGLQNSERELNAGYTHLSTHQTDAYGALGLQYNLNQKVALTAEYERYGKNKNFGAEPNVLTVGARYSF